MKKTLLILAAIATINCSYAQTDSTTNNVDTIKKGNLQRSDTSKTKKSISISVGTDDLLDIKINNNNKKNKNITTNWWIFDLGFANFRDQTNYATAQSGSYFQANAGTPKVSANDMNLINNKSSNVNLWFFMQKFNIAKYKLNLKYGLGLEMYNFRYEHSLSYRKDPMNYIINDKNKVFVSGYLGRDVFSSGFKSNWGNTTATIRWNHLFNEKLFLNTTSFYSNYDYALQSDLKQKNDHGQIKYSSQKQFGLWTYYDKNGNIEKAESKGEIH